MLLPWPYSIILPKTGADLIGRFSVTAVSPFTGGANIWPMTSVGWQVRTTIFMSSGASDGVRKMGCTTRSSRCFDYPSGGAQSGDGISDAFDDCLTDLPIRDDGGAVLVLNRFNVYESGHGSVLMHSGRAEAQAVLDIMARACRFFLLNGKRFIVLVQTENPNLQIGSLGGASPVWNRRERLSANRSPESSKETS